MREGLTYFTEKIKRWSCDRGLHQLSSVHQLNKLMEEVGELASAMNKGKHELIVDSIGDVYVVLVVLSQQCGLDIRDCIEAAYCEIQNRGGAIVDGNFIKEADLREDE